MSELKLIRDQILIKNKAYNFFFFSVLIYTITMLQSWKAIIALYHLLGIYLDLRKAKKTIIYKIHNWFDDLAICDYLYLPVWRVQKSGFHFTIIFKFKVTKIILITLTVLVSEIFIRKSCTILEKQYQINTKCLRQQFTHKHTTNQSTTGWLYSNVSQAWFRKLLDYDLSNSYQIKQHQPHKKQAFCFTILKS